MYKPSISVKNVRLLLCPLCRVLRATMLTVYSVKGSGENLNIGICLIKNIEVDFVKLIKSIFLVIIFINHLVYL